MLSRTAVPSGSAIYPAIMAQRAHLVPGLSVATECPDCSSVGIAERLHLLLDDLACLEPRRSMRDDATATIDFRYDPMDISRIYVWNRVTRKYVVLKCSNERYADGMPLFLHEKIAKEARDQSQAFNTEEQRLLARGRTIQAVRECIHPAARAESRKRLGELLEIPRIRSITGNLVHLLDTDLPQSSLSDFIGTDRAALTCVDQEILSSRPTPKPAIKNKALRARRIAEERREEGEAGISLPSESGRTFAKKGGYQ
ncbi:hypothetical protein I5E68_01520 [Novosphingobium sp. YJ-S2-02]|uniref:Transposase-like Mu C-terminal domain-containing protein n=1 Tax=Novosphingobium aureum TaxID=2792964 RepID=A0A931H951_9SPHN|nr:hypothetical protein [Novosphingobium aureum]MBH0111630.1 hypothetical protein [Novosphingobium aureum]